MICSSYCIRVAPTSSLENKVDSGVLSTTRSCRRRCVAIDAAAKGAPIRMTKTDIAAAIGVSRQTAYAVDLRENKARALGARW